MSLHGRAPHALYVCAYRETVPNTNTTLAEIKVPYTEIILQNCAIYTFLQSQRCAKLLSSSLEAGIRPADALL